LRKFLFLLLCTFALASCEDKISSLGAPYYADTIQFRTVTRSDSTFFTMRHVQDTFVSANGVTKNLTSASPIMFVGRVNSGTENVESWGLLKFPLLADTLRPKVVGMRMILKDDVFKYGDPTTKVDFKVYEEGGGKVSDSLRSLSLADLSANPIGAFTGDLADTVHSTLDIPLDTSLISQLGASSLAFVVTPGATMTNVRGFGTSDHSDVNSRPQLEFTIRVSPDSTTTVVLNPTTDLSLVKDASTTPAGAFTVRGSAGTREFVKFNLATDSAGLNRFVTVNSAQYVLHLDPANTRLGTDSIQLVIVHITPTDDTLEAIGVRDTKDPNTIRFEMRNIIEYFVRNPEVNYGFEIRAGFFYRTFAGKYIPVEDNTLNRWTIYGLDYSDPALRPQFILSYSKLP